MYIYSVDNRSCIFIVLLDHSPDVDPFKTPVLLVLKSAAVKRPRVSREVFLGAVPGSVVIILH